MEWNQTTIGATLIIAGILAYLAAVDVFTALPGNFLFFGGVIVLAWGSENPVAKGFLMLAVMSLVFIVTVIGVLIYRSRKSTSHSA